MRLVMGFGRRVLHTVVNFPQPVTLVQASAFHARQQRKRPAKKRSLVRIIPEVSIREESWVRKRE